MSKWIGPTITQLWNYAILVLHNFVGLTKHNSLLFGPIHPSPPTSKELHGVAHFAEASQRRRTQRSQITERSHSCSLFLYFRRFKS